MSFSSKLILSRVFLVSSLSLAVACQDPGAGHSAAKVEAASAPSAPAVAAGASQKRLAVQAAASAVAFQGAKLTAKHDGSFSDLRGEVTLVDGDLQKSSVLVRIGMDSLSVEPAKLAGHLKSPDFFDVAKFPEAVFQSTSVKAGGEGGKSHTIVGNLELHGVKKAITFPANLRLEGGQISVDAEFSINRKDFGIVYPGMPDDLIQDNVLIRLRVKAS